MKKRWVAALLAALLLVALGAAMPHLKRNHWIGVRTKWTLQSDAVWEKSQRFGGKAFVAAGVLCLVGMFLPFGQALVFPIALFCTMIWNILCSLIVFYLCRNILNYAELNQR